MQFIFDLTEVKVFLQDYDKKRHYNKRHTPIDLVCKRIPKIACKKIKKAINELDNEEIIILKPTYHGMDVSLNVKKKKEIDNYLNQINN